MTTARGILACCLGAGCCLVQTGCNVEPLPLASDAALAAANEDAAIRQAVVRNELDVAASVPVCVKIGDRDAGDDFLARFGPAANVHKGSQFRPGAGILLTLGPIERPDPFQAKIIVSRYKGSSGMGYEYSLELRGTTWVITGITTIWIS